MSVLALTRRWSGLPRATGAISCPSSLTRTRSTPSSPVALDHDRDVVRLGVQRIPDQLDNRLDKPVTVRKAKARVILGVDVEPSHGCGLPHRADSSPVFTVCPRSRLARSAERTSPLSTGGDPDHQRPPVEIRSRGGRAVQPHLGPVASASVRSGSSGRLCMSALDWDTTAGFFTGSV